MVTERVSDRVKLSLSHEEAVIFANLLNEVLRGFRVENLESTIGADRQQIEDLWNRMASVARATKDRDGSLDLSSGETSTILAICGLCLKELEGEFSTRVGFTPKETAILMSQLRQTLPE